MAKKELADKIVAQRKSVQVTISRFSEEKLIEPKTVDQWSIKDVLVHLTMWEAELVRTIFQAAQGQKPDTLIFVDDFDIVNQKWFATFQDRPLANVLADFDGVSRQIIKQVENYPTTDLFTPGAYTWLGNQSLAGLIEDICVVHVEHHRNDIEIWLAKQK